MDGLHPYDGVERRYAHTDPDTTAGRALVARLLRLPSPPPSAELRYDISIYSGGIGVLDRIAVSLPGSPTTLRAVLVGLRAKTPDEAVADPRWREDFVWLLLGEDDPLPVREAAAAFIEQERRPFQPRCRAGDGIWFAFGSDVNDWSAVWERDGTLSVLGYAQG